MKRISSSIFLFLIFAPCVLLAQTLDVKKVDPPAKTAPSPYLGMTEKEQLAYIKNYVNNFSFLLAPDAPLTISSEGVARIKKWVDAYAARVKPTDPTQESLEKILTRGRSVAPLINTRFEEKGVVSILGASMAMVLSEYNPCFSAPNGGKGLFAILPAAAQAYQVKPDELCQEEKNINVAAQILKANLKEFGKNGGAAAIAILAFQRGNLKAKKDFAPLLAAHDNGDQLWTLLLAPDEKKFDKAFVQETAVFLPKVFAAAVITESPETFGVNLAPLSTYFPDKK